MNSVNRGPLQGNFPSANVDVPSNRSRLNQDYKDQTGLTSLAERDIKTKIGLSFCDEEFYEQIKGFDNNPYRGSI